jgi:predicted adenylyl cyclase CyaB
MSSLPESCRLNVELKAWVHDLQLARAVARQLTTRPLEKLGQRDTYFHCPTGRFKLREMDQQPGQLIWYQRASEQQARSSHYMLVDVSDPEGMRNLLAATLGIRAVVEKQREVYFYDNVRIHLDQVRSLGTFLEFEAVLEHPDQLPEGHEQLAFLRGQFSIAEKDLLEGSYGEMVEQAGE